MHDCAKLDSKFPISYDILVMSLKIACWIWYNQKQSARAQILGGHIKVGPESESYEHASWQICPYIKGVHFLYIQKHTYIALRIINVWLQNQEPEIHPNLHLVHSNSCSPSRIFTAPDRMTVPLRVRRQPTSLTRIRPILGLVSAS